MLRLTWCELFGLRKSLKLQNILRNLSNKFPEHVDLIRFISSMLFFLFSVKSLSGNVCFIELKNRRTFYCCTTSVSKRLAYDWSKWLHEFLAKRKPSNDDQRNYNESSRQRSKTTSLVQQLNGFFWRKKIRRKYFWEE